MVFKTLRAGFYRMWQFRRILVLYYLASLLFAIFAMIPARTFLSNYLGDSLWGERLANGADMHLILEFLLNADGFLPVVMVALVLASLFYWLGLLFLSGGAFSLYCHAERYQAREFWGQAGAFLGRFIRLGLYTLVVLALDITAIQLMTVVLMATLASIGTAGVPGVGLVMLAGVLTQVGLPVEAIGLVLGVDRLLDMTRTAVNITGDAMVTCVVAKSEGELDLETFNNPEAGLDEIPDELADFQHG